MRVLLVHNFYRSQHIGGEDVVFRQELATLRQVLGDSAVSTYTVSNDTLSKTKLLHQIWGNQAHADAILKQAIEQRVDVVHAHNVFPLITPRFFKQLRDAQIPSILTLHNYRPWCLSGVLYRTDKGHCVTCFEKGNFLPSMKNRCYRGSVPLSILGGAALQWYQWQQDWQAVGKFFVLSQHQMQQLQTFGVDQNKLWLKPNFVETLNAPWVESTHKSGYLYVGRLEPDKGIDWLLQQWQSLPEQYRLTVIGCSPHETNYAARYAKRNIIFKGQTDRATTLAEMAKAKYLIHPSLMPETFGLTVIEAQSLGTPVIALKCGPREQMIVHQITGWHYEPESFQSVLRAANDFEGYAQMTYNAKQSALSYQPDVIIKQQMNYYEQLCREKSNA